MPDKVYLKWVQHFAELDKKEIPFTLADMTQKAKELVEEE